MHRLNLPKRPLTSESEQHVQATHASPACEKRPPLRGNHLAARDRGQGQQGQAATDPDPPVQEAVLAALQAPRRPRFRGLTPNLRSQTPSSDSGTPSSAEEPLVPPPHSRKTMFSSSETGPSFAQMWRRDYRLSQEISIGGNPIRKGWLRLSFAETGLPRMETAHAAKIPFTSVQRTTNRSRTQVPQLLHPQR